MKNATLQWTIKDLTAKNLCQVQTSASSPANELEIAKAQDRFVMPVTSTQNSRNPRIQILSLKSLTTSFPPNKSKQCFQQIRPCEENWARSEPWEMRLTASTKKPWSAFKHLGQAATEAANCGRSATPFVFTRFYHFLSTFGIALNWRNGNSCKYII